MMVVGLCSVLFDLEGDVVVNPHPDTNLGELSRRVNKDKTLDGGVAVTDGGFSEADRDIMLVWKTLAPAREAIITGIVKTHSLVNVCTRDGVFQATPGAYRTSRGRSSVQMIVRERLDA